MTSDCDSITNIVSKSLGNRQIFISISIYIYMYIYVYIVFITEGFLEVAIESRWHEGDLNPQPLNSVQRL